MCRGRDFPPSVMTTTFPKARKAHKCCECGLPIPVGAKYVRTWGVWDGDADSYAQHTECHDLLNYISRHHCDNEPWTFGSLREEVGEYSAELTAKLVEIETKYREATP